MAAMWLHVQVVIAIIYLLAVILPSANALRTALKIVWFLVAGVMALSFLPAATEGFFFGAIFALIAALIFTWGSGVRAVTLSLRLKAVPTVVMCLMGLILLPLHIAVVIRAVEWWDQWWVQRPTSEACRKAVFDVRLAELRLAVPAAPMFVIQKNIVPPKNPTASLTHVMLHTPAQRREACAAYANGTKSLAALGVSAVRHETESMTEYCGSAPAWAAAICAERQSIYKYDSPFPMHAEMFLGEHGGVKIWTTDPEQTGSTEVITVLQQSNDLPLSFKCRPTKQRQQVLFCSARHPWRNGAWVAYSFFAPREDVVALGLRFEKAVTDLFGKLIEPVAQ